MKIGIDARMQETGIGRYTNGLIGELGRIDNINQYVILLPASHFDSYQLPGKNFSKILADIPHYSAAEQQKLLVILKKEGFDLVHFPHFNVPVRYRDPFVVTIHDLTHTKFKNVRATTLGPIKYFIKNLGYQKVIRHAVNESRAIISPSEYVKKQVVKEYSVPAKKIIVTHEAFQPHLTRTIDRMVLADLGISRPFLLYVGNAYPHKNLENFILAFGKLTSGYNHDLQLVIAGKKDAFHDRIAKEVLAVGLQHRVIFTDYIDDHQLAALYSQAKLFVFPSLSEGFGLPPMEALSVGTPAIISNTTSLPEIYGDSAAYFDPYSISDMSSKMHAFLSDWKAQQKTLIEARKRLKKYSWAQLAAKTLEVYKKATKG